MRIACDLLLFGCVAFAGGLEVTTCDVWPATLRAGKTYQFGFMMRQYGVTPFRDGTPTLILTRGRDTVRMAAHAEGAPGHYVVDVTFPSDGEWAWSVDQRPFPQVQELGTVTIAPMTVQLEPLPVRPPAELVLFGLVLVGAFGSSVALRRVRLAGAT